MLLAIRLFPTSSQITVNADHSPPPASILSTTSPTQFIWIWQQTEHMRIYSETIIQNQDTLKILHQSLHPSYLIQFQALAIPYLHLRPPNTPVNNNLSTLQAPNSLELIHNPNETLSSASPPSLSLSNYPSTDIER